MRCEAVASEWQEVSRAAPCPICGKPDWCGRTADGAAVRCMRIAEAPAGWRAVKTHDDGGTSFALEDAPRRNGAATRSTPRRKGKTYPTIKAAISAIERHVGECTARWVYSDSFIVARFDGPKGKDFRPLHRDGDGWRVGDPPGALPLYRRGELSGIARVFVVEGEKCADAAWSIGLPATTSAHGSKSAAKTDWRPLAGREIVILPDADEAGAHYASTVAAILDRLGCEVRIVNLPDLPASSGADVVDFIAERRTEGKRDEAIKQEIKDLADLAKPWKPSEADAQTSPLRTVRLADVEPERLRWLWPARIPLGKLTLLYGDPCLGKSFLTMDLAARVSTGAGWPDLPGERSEPGGVILLTAEDGLADTVRPRLDAAGADVSRIEAIESVGIAGGGERSVNLGDDLRLIEERIAQRGDVRLFIIDPISAYCGKADSHTNADVRGMLAPIAKLAERHGVAIVAVSHLNKGAGGRAMYRAMGSLAFIAAARAGWLVVEDENDPAKRLLLPTKMNLAAKPSGMAFLLRNSGTLGEVPSVAWDADPVDLSADDALAAIAGHGGDDDGRKGALGEAVDFLHHELASGAKPSGEVKKAARAAGIAPRTLDRARAELGVVAAPDGFGGPWTWALPAQSAPESAECAIPESMANTGEVGELCKPAGGGEAQPAAGSGGART